MEKLYQAEKIIKNAGISAPEDDYPAYVAVQKSYLYWLVHDKNKRDRRAPMFKNMFMVPANFDLPDHRLKNIVYFCEKTITRYRREYLAMFYEDYEYLKTLPQEELEIVCKALKTMIQEHDLPENA
ncbi:MAG: hypothetical protein DBX59_02270 [Bacillota bacterium]|nr:MAG: hypothetical protein DBX59_02270 [Bacillota bacterium]